ncbi:pyrroline-5-carboxylate reductase dimerization domain-containing protein [Croceicoccus sp. F390]|uniref:Pyrroline-5-carboxylate reductase n=1 Tax=Croceicoccus esteveae TaxID=3075597 RepID=A0ABU2ZH75_9SPHN|nr:pyrroline-5-carboxylate reductase dimerization domain-containing protein [Croceicoccus sp. F390]MDT0575644.1 pyrroline-5-carboxylate reductase dimerization domain-containing protein [Croceicoccus sp. F390]
MLLVGCGNMAGAMLDGWLAAGLDSQMFTIVDPYRKAAPGGVRLLKTLPDEAFDMVMLGIKPQMLKDAAPRIRPLAGSDTIVLSILAGTMLATLDGFFPEARAIVRVMPNLSARLGKSPIALVSADINERERSQVDAMAAPLGTLEWLPDESLFDLVTALAGSGPGFVYRFIDALAAAAATLGLPREQADRLALATVNGSAQLAAESAHSPADLARQVASPGGVTQAGLDTLDDDDALLRLMTRTLANARDRSAQMARDM